MNQEVLVICESFYHGNTEKIAQSIGQALNCQVVTAEQAMKMDLQKYSFLGLGSGIYFTSHHPKLLQISRLLNPKQKVFLFSTHGAPFVGKYHQALKRKLEERKIPVIGNFSCPGYDGTGPYLIFGGGNKGRPHEKDQRRAAAFAVKLLPQFSKDTGTVKNGKYVEVRQNECIACQNCVRVCPMNVFEMQQGKSKVCRAIDCIHCGLCLQNCPEKAISVQHSWKEAIAIAKHHAKKISL